MKCYCIILIILILTSCQSEFTLFKEKATTFANSDNYIDEKEYQILLDEISCSDERDFKQFKNIQGVIDSSKVVTYLLKQFKLTKADIWQPITNLKQKTININVYIENSGSMDGYVKGVTEFEQAVYNYLTDIKISKFTDSLNLFYINSDIIPQGSDISDFIEKLDPTTFKNKGGSRGTTDISNLLKSVLTETKPNEISILVTDGIFSPGVGKDAEQYLVNQQIGIKSSMADYLDKYPNSAVVIYQLSSKFDGWYYNREDSRTKINEERPYYLWIIGKTDLINDLILKVPENKFKGSGVQNVFSITGGPKSVDYAVKMGSGKFDLDKKEPKTTIENLKKETKGQQNSARFSVNANLSGFLLSDNYLRDISNYELNNKDFALTICNSVSNNFGYTHQLNFESGSVHKGVISVKLKTLIPQWVEDINDSIGSIPVNGKTYGIKYQIHGIYEAFTISNNYYTEIKIKIN